LYAYVSNDPLNRIDPFGLQSEGDEEDIIVTGSRRPPQSLTAFWIDWMSQNDPVRMLEMLMRPARQNETPRQRRRRTDEGAVDRCEGGSIRPPDFLIFEFVPLEYGEIAAAGTHGIVDRYGNVYIGIQGGVGAGPLDAVEYNVYAGWMITPTAPTQAQLRGFLGGGALTFDVTGPNVGIEDVVGFGVGFAGNNNGSSVLTGFGTPGVNLQGAWSFHITQAGMGDCQW
jgi:hypothetical protein